MKQRLLALLLAAGLILSLAACGDPAADSSSAPSADTSPAPSEEIEVDLTQGLIPFSAGVEPDTAALTVNGQEVNADLFLYWLALNATYFMQMTGQPVDSYADILMEDSQNLTAYYTLLQQKALEEGCPLTDEQTAAIQQSLMADGEETYENRKTLFGLTDETMTFIYSVSDYYDNLLENLTDVPTQQDLEQYISDQGIFAVKHILLMTVDTSGTPTVGEDGSYTYPSLSQEELDEKKALAEDLLAQLQASDDMETLFDQLMEEYSEDGRNADGTLASPDGYVFSNADSLVDGFREAALALEPGQLSGIVETDYGYHIMLRGEVDPADYTDVCRQSQLDAQIDQWLEQAEITLSPQMESLDVPAFFNRYVAWQDAMAEQIEAESGGDDPAASASPQPSSSETPVG